MADVDLGDTGAELRRLRARVAELEALQDLAEDYAREAGAERDEAVAGAEAAEKRTAEHVHYTTRLERGEHRDAWSDVCCTRPADHDGAHRRVERSGDVVRWLPAEPDRGERTVELERRLDEHERTVAADGVRLAELEAENERWRAAVATVRQGSGLADIESICALIEQLATGPDTSEPAGRLEPAAEVASGPVPVTPGERYEVTATVRPGTPPTVQGITWALAPGEGQPPGATDEPVEEI